MRLFAVREYRKGPLITDQFGDVIYYDNKTVAKRQRDRIGGRAVVTLGPDHKYYEGN
jgi:hypothetical protein